MGFRREMHNGIRLLAYQKCGDGSAITDVELDELVSGARAHACQGIQIPGISQLVQIYDPVVRVIDQVPHDRGSDEASAAGDENFHCCSKLYLRYPNGLTV